MKKKTVKGRFVRTAKELLESEECCYGKRVEFEDGCTGVVINSEFVIGRCKVGRYAIFLRSQYYPYTIACGYLYRKGKWA